MEKEYAKKTVILYVLNILMQISSESRPITFTVLADALNELGIACDRKTVGRNVDALIDFGYPIVKVKGGGCYYDNSKPLIINMPSKNGTQR